jgi:hypothetical protein
MLSVYVSYSLHQPLVISPSNSCDIQCDGLVRDCVEYLKRPLLSLSRPLAERGCKDYVPVAVGSMEIVFIAKIAIQIRICPWFINKTMPITEIVS